jgi:hypothetical protein
LKTGRNLKATVRPNGVAAQAFEPSIPAKNRRQSLTMALIPQSFWTQGDCRSGAC